jgi:hypothetical protein
MGPFGCLSLIPMRLPAHSAVLTRVSQRAAVSFLAGFLLVLYLLGGFGGSPVHTHPHEAPIDIHFAGCEQDPCHAAVYHFNRSGACHHKAHLTRSIEEDCSLCGMMFFRQDLPPETMSFVVREWSSSAPVILQETPVIVATIVPFGRGPPAA